jgi:NADH:ubiquinone oxidoreductase subunit
MKPLCTTALVLLCGTSLATAGEWVEMFNGQNLDGWKISTDNPASITVKDGTIVLHGERAHAFYDADQPFDDFEFECEVLTTPGSNSGIYFHTKYQEEGWPKYGYEAQVNATHGDPKKSGSLYAVENTSEAPHEDGKWFPYRIRVKGKQITITVNGKTTIDWTEPEDRAAGNDFTRVLDKGTIALQAHDPKSEVRFRKLRIKRLDG